MTNNMVAHFEDGSSDKIYIACVRKETNGTWTTIGKWGRRGKMLQEQIKLSGATESRAKAEMAELFHEKLAKGYQNVESPSYNGDIRLDSTYIKNHLEAEESKIFQPVKGQVKTFQEPLTVKEKMQAACPATAVCVDNLGMEERFDMNVEYVIERHKEDDMLWAFDKSGAKVECLKERFKV